MELVDQAVAYLREGFANINNPKGLLIALAATLFLGSWKQWFPISLVAVIVHIAIEQLAPVLAGNGGAVVLPDITSETFWTRVLVLLLGYLIIIGVFFFVKRMIFRGGGGGH
ncbi:hypothetical protein [Vitreimonas flagellata]|uniref:hypothetical protein n=1 Tax=Vitreimonas flagellata TaxID=2560861 RepID=UPI0010758A71|nr:hypothetical protein [Vitreimonas flagellata]